MQLHVSLIDFSDCSIGDTAMGFAKLYRYEEFLPLCYMDYGRTFAVTFCMLSLDYTYDRVRVMNEHGEKQLAAERLVNLLESPVATINGQVGADVLWARYFSSAYGIAMNEQPYRFPHFASDRGNMVSDSGIDVLPREHQMQTGMFVAWILDREVAITGTYPIAPKDIGKVMLTAFVHDIGEITHPDILAEVGAVVGDIPFGHKTDEDRRVEAAVRKAMYRRLYPDVLPDEIQRIEAIIAHQDDTTMHDLFEAAHCVQALNTAIHTGSQWAGHWWNILEGAEPARSDEQMDQMHGLFDEVLTNIIPHVTHWASKFIFVRDFTLMHADLLQARPSS